MVPAIVLAAGKSARMGRTKALLTLPGGETFLSRIVRTLQAGGVEHVVVVAGADVPGIRGAMDRERINAQLVENPDYERGQLSSLQAGLRAIEGPDVSAAMVALIDVPLIAATTVRVLLEHYRSAQSLIVRPARGEDHGHPVIFARALFNEFYSADPSVGAKAVVRTHEDRTLNLDVDDEGAFIDVDTPEQYHSMIGRLGDSKI